MHVCMVSMNMALKKNLNSKKKKEKDLKLVRAPYLNLNLFSPLLSFFSSVVSLSFVICHCPKKLESIRVLQR